MNWKYTLLICIVIFLAAGTVTTFIFMTEPEAQREGATKQTAILVDVDTIKPADYSPQILTTGTVQAAKEIMLSPRVNGEITRCSNSFVPGGFVRKSQLLLKIDPADFQNNLAMRQSELSQAVADLNIEKGRQEVARKDFQLVGDTLSIVNKDLVLRKPQLEAIKARIAAVEASIKQAELALERTDIKAPFDAQIIERNANVGSQVSPGNNLGRLVGTDEYWVETTIPLSKLQWLTFPDARNSKGSKVKIRNRTAWQEGVYREGYLFRLIGALDNQTRFARVLVSIPDPMARLKRNAGRPPLIIGTFLELNIQAKKLTDVVRLDRDYIREDNTVWLMEKDKLHIQPVVIAFQDVQYAYVKDSLVQGDQVVMTNLSTIVEGTPLRLSSESTADSITSSPNK